MWFALYSIINNKVWSTAHAQPAKSNRGFHHHHNYHQPYLLDYRSYSPVAQQSLLQGDMSHTCLVRQMEDIPWLGNFWDHHQPASPSSYPYFRPHNSDPAPSSNAKHELRCRSGSLSWIHSTWTVYKLSNKERINSMQWSLNTYRED